MSSSNKQCYPIAITGTSLAQVSRSLLDPPTWILIAHYADQPEDNLGEDADENQADELNDNEG